MASAWKNAFQTQIYCTSCKGTGPAKKVLVSMSGTGASHWVNVCIREDDAGNVCGARYAAQPPGQAYDATRAREISRRMRALETRGQLNLFHPDPRKKKG